MRELSDMRAQTEISILRHALTEIASRATGSHQTEPCYADRRLVGDYAQRHLELSRRAR